jgi:hypothetical protein
MAGGHLDDEELGQRGLGVLVGRSFLDENQVPLSKSVRRKMVSK